MSYEDFIPHPSTFLASRDSAREESVSWWRWLLVAFGVATVAFLVWLLFFRGKAPSVAPSAAKATAEIANPFNWK